MEVEAICSGGLMDHSYSKERTKVQKIDHSYFTVGKKTPAVVLRKAQQQKQDQCHTRPGIDQDHTYTRPDHSEQASLTDKSIDETIGGTAIEMTNCFIPSGTMCTESSKMEDADCATEKLPFNLPTVASPGLSSQAWRCMPIIVQPDEIQQSDSQLCENEPFDSIRYNNYSSHDPEKFKNNSKGILENSATAFHGNDLVVHNTTYDLDEIDCLISDINLDHTYEVRATVRPRRRVGTSTVSCVTGVSGRDTWRENDNEEMPQVMDDDSSNRLSDHTYLDFNSLDRTRSNKCGKESIPAGYWVPFNDHTYWQPGGRLKGTSNPSIEGVLRTDHTYLQSNDDYQGLPCVRKAKSEANLMCDEPQRLGGSSTCQRSDDHTYLNSEEGRLAEQRMCDDNDRETEDQFSDDLHEAAGFVDGHSLDNDESHEEPPRVDHQYGSTLVRHSWTGLDDHSYETDVCKRLVEQ